MKLYEILQDNIIESEYKVVYYDEDKCKNIEVANVEDMENKYINTMYSKNDIIYVEIEI